MRLTTATFKLRVFADAFLQASEALHDAACTAEEGQGDLVAWDLLGDPEVVGHDQCPVMYRWTLGRPFGCKVMLHHFLPNGDDPEPHDHPWTFWTLILGGGYVDEQHYPDGSVGLEPMFRGRIRRRTAEHMHRTLVNPNGCWSIVVSMPASRDWGFLWNGAWMPMAEYLDKRGEAAIRCDR